MYKVLSVCLSVVFGEEYLAHNASPLSRFSQRERERETRRSGIVHKKVLFFGPELNRSGDPVSRSTTTQRTQRSAERERERETRRSGKEYTIKCFFSDLN